MIFCWYWWWTCSRRDERESPHGSYLGEMMNEEEGRTVDEIGMEDTESRQMAGCWGSGH